MVCAYAVAVESNSRAQAAKARQRAQSWAPVLDNSTDRGPIGTESVCGYNSLVADNSITNCRIVSSFGGTAFSCSAFKIGDNLLGTAGKVTCMTALRIRHLSMQVDAHICHL